MPFFIRKPFSKGPFRFNVSKSGIGISFGVTGARIGIRPNGRIYTHAGRFGLYHRQELGRMFKSFLMFRDLLVKSDPKAQKKLPSK